MDWKEKLAEAHKLMEEIKAIQANEESGAEEKAKIPQMLKDFQTLKTDAGQLREIQMSAKELEAEMQAANEPEPEVKEREPNDGGPPVPPTGYDIKQRRVKGSDFDDGGEFLYTAWQAATGCNSASFSGDLSCVMSETPRTRILGMCSWLAA